MTVVYIGAGHFPNTPGKRSPDDEREYSFNVVVVESAIKHLTYNGFKIIRGDDPKRDVPLKERRELADRHDVKLYISVHHNALKGIWGTHGGTETFYFEGSVNGKRAADFIHREVVKAYGLVNRGLKAGNTPKTNYYEIIKPKAPSVLIEGGFMDSTVDIKRMRDNKVLEEAGKGIARGVCAYFGRTFKEEEPVKKPVVDRVATFIRQVEKGAVEGYNAFGILPSISIAQAILESGWGTSELATKGNNLFGVKASADWKGDSVLILTKEMDKSGKVHEVHAHFRKYKSKDDSIKDHSAFFTSTPWRVQNYAPVILAKDYKKQAEALQTCGYATDRGYAEKLIRVIEEHNLSQFDAPVSSNVYRVLIDGVQVAAYREPSNILQDVEKAVREGKKDIHIQKK